MNIEDLPLAPGAVVDPPLIPEGFPVPAAELVEELRQNILTGTGTTYPPTDDELRVLAVYEEHEFYMFGGDHQVASFWHDPPEEREYWFQYLLKDFASYMEEAARPEPKLHPDAVYDKSAPWNQDLDGPIPF